MTGERTPRDLFEVEDLAGEPADLRRPVGHGRAVDLAMLQNAQDLPDRRLDRFTRPHRR